MKGLKPLVTSPLGTTAIRGMSMVCCTTTSVARRTTSAGEQEVVADAPVRANATADVADVGADPFVFILAVITWKSTHALDPSLPLQSDKKPITIRVVALRWKWLFIYPEQNIATVNFIQFPIATPINFELTADGPMNSFWIPELGGQIYAMTGMQTKRHLMANAIGEFSGAAAEINGKGFSGMKFIVLNIINKSVINEEEGYRQNNEEAQVFH